MKKLNITLLLLLISTASIYAQMHAYNPFTQNIKFSPEPSTAGFGCGTIQSVVFTQGITTADSTIMWQSQPLIVKIYLKGFKVNGTTAAAAIGGDYASNFNWTMNANKDTITGVQNQMLYGTGTNPLFPDPRSSGKDSLSLIVPSNSPIGTVLGVDVQLVIPAYMVATNSTGDDPEATQTQSFCALSLSGTVFNDVNGLTNTNVDGVGIGNPSSTQLYANLVGPSGNVVATTAVASNGTYTFNNVTPSTTYAVWLSTTQGTVGNTPPAISLPTNWVNTGEDCCDNIGSDGAVDGKVTVTVGLVSSTNANFGIQELPTPGTNTQPTQLNPGGTVNVTVPTSAFSGTDPSGGTITSLKICSFPTNATTITIGSTIYTSATFPGAGVVLTTNAIGQPTQTVTIDPVDGAITSVITYSVTDNALFPSACIGTVNVPFSVISLSGTVFEDNDGPTNVNGTGIGMPSSTPLYAHLIGTSGNVIARVNVAANGTFIFPDVTPNVSYTVVVSTTQANVGNPAPVVTLPFGWNNVSEDCCDNTGNDGLTDGKVAVSMTTTSQTNANFGITQPLSLGNSIWNDINQDGLRNIGETPIANAIIKLYADANMNNVPDGAAIDSTTSNASGLYLFDGLRPGSYIVGVTPPTPSSGPAYASSNGPGQEANPNLDVDNNDNGITTVGTETRSNFITLLAGTEPKNESPNNDATKPDSNSNLTLDFGFYQSITIAGNVYNDQNGPTNVDGTPLGMAGTAQLYANLVDTSGKVIAVQAVNTGGTYNFNDVKPNTTYEVVLSTTASTIGNNPPAATLPFGWTNVAEDCCDNIGNDGNTNGKVSVNVAQLNVTNANFGIHQPISIGNSVWHDINQNGLRETGESNIPNAVVKLYLDANQNNVPDGPAIDSTTTNASGLYLFDNLDANSYIVGVIPPTPASGPAYLSTSGANEELNPNLDIDNNDNGVNQVGNETRTNFITLLQGSEPTNENPNNDLTKPNDNTNLTIDFGFYQAIRISGTVFNDQNGPANVDGTPTGKAGTAQLYANLINLAGNVVAVDTVKNNGTFAFNNVQPNAVYSVVLSSTIGVVNSPAPAKTLAFGWTNVSEDCCDNIGNDGNTNGETSVVLGTVDRTNVNFGIHEPMSLGNSVWNDINQDGLNNNNEAGIANAVVKLYRDFNKDNIADGSAIDSTITSPAGLYLFDNIDTGSYIVGVFPPVPSTGPNYKSTNGAGQEANPNLDVDNNDNGVVSVGTETRSNYITLFQGTEPQNEIPNNNSTKPDSNSNLTLDFGFYQPIKIEGNVYKDVNGPANVDGTPIGIAGSSFLFANLVNASGTVVAVQQVSFLGKYEFADVSPNQTYTVVLSTTAGVVSMPAPAAVLPFGWDNVSEDCCDNIGNDGVANGITSVVVVTSDKSEVNFGIHQPMSVGNQVFNDVNQNGVKNAGEVGIQGATVNLYFDSNQDNLPDGPVFKTTTTDSQGLYLFDDLDADSYIIGVIPPASQAAAFVSSITGEESNPNLNVDNNDNGVIQVGNETRTQYIVLLQGTEPINENPNNDNTKPDNNSNLTIDFAFYSPIQVTGNVYNDENGPTNVDGTPISMAGIEQLYVSLVNTMGVVERVDTVNPDGTFIFNDVTPNKTYKTILSTNPGIVANAAPAVVLPFGWINVAEDCCDNVGNDGTTNGETPVVVATSNLDFVNFGIRSPLAIGNSVWVDSNKNGVKDPSEGGLAGAIVKIYNDVDSNQIPDGPAIDSTTTGSNGLYAFELLRSGNYIIGVTPPTVANGNYESPVTGEEANPNLNVDNNDNGITKVGLEVRSGTMTLLQGTEPTAETPNNATLTLDANANLTLDFGFYVCPNSFVFDTVLICQNTSFNLTSIEPAGFTGGTWKDSTNATVPNSSAVSTGKYTYTYTNGGCTASGTVVIRNNIPDYVPTIAIDPASVQGPDSVTVVLTISEILQKSACSQVFVLVPKLTGRFGFAYDSTKTSIGFLNTPINNNDWIFYGNVNPNYYIWEYKANGGIFPAGGASKIGYKGKYDPNNTDGKSTFSVQIFQGSGGESNPLNNTDSEILNYTR